MKPLVFAVVLSGAAAAATAQDASWFTVVGDPASAATDTVEVDATSAVAFESMRLVKLRVNRATPRTAFDGKPFRSYYSTAMVDCKASKAWHRTISLYSDPLWRGQVRMHDYAESDGRSLAFADMADNPRNRLIKAACAIALQDNK